MHQPFLPGFTCHDKSLYVAFQEIDIEGQVFEIIDVLKGEILGVVNDHLIQKRHVNTRRENAVATTFGSDSRVQATFPNHCESDCQLRLSSGILTWVGIPAALLGQL